MAASIWDESRFVDFRGLKPLTASVYLHIPLSRMLAKLAELAQITENISVLILSNI